MFGACAGAARILGLNVEQTVHALGIAGTQAFGIRQVLGTDVKVKGKKRRQMYA